MTTTFDEPIEIAQDIFWVGHIIENDPFQCHVYLIKNKDQPCVSKRNRLVKY